MDTGGLAQMTYNNMPLNTSSLAVPGSGFASRGKGSHIKRLSVPHPSKLDQRDDAHGSVSTPRTSRSHLLAGLRTAPKQPTTPSTAPLMQEHPHQNGFGGMQNYGGHSNAYLGGVPQTATGVSFNHSKSYSSGNAAQTYGQMYSLPEHVLAPPALDHILEENGEPMDEALYAELVSTNLYLAAQQQRLQQQLASVTAAAQQFQALHIGTPLHSTHAQALQQQQQQQQIFSPLPTMGFYQQQAQHGMQPVVHPVPGKPGVFSVYNPMTGQQSYVVDNSVYDEVPLSAAPTTSTYEDQIRSPVESHTSNGGFHAHTNGNSNGHTNGNTHSMFRTSARVSPPPAELHQSPVRNHSSTPSTRNPTPPREAQSQVLPQQQARQSPPLQSPAPGIKRDHKKSLSLAVKLINESTRSGNNGASTPKSAMFPQTPASAGPGTFGPGQNRAGEHAIRQPRGPPPLEELVAKPTTKHEGSKNFATRQRRRAVHSLVRARLERNTSTSTSNGNSHSTGSVTPSSEHGNEHDGEGEFSFSPSDGDADSSSSLSGRRSLGSLRAAANGAIGSERKQVSGATNNGTGELDAGRRKMPIMVLSNAEKRKSTVM
ncbi:hypothetical protein A7D00_0757 [Trichophyton violaceum]|uniref:Uncharacterized protein n=1 Tax=Trichophyton violaceum TaxID=34388 RepID=A0A178FSK0_TRIVO|nr:hypothetical protein A7D00_0757 [Trichophyton violaceum]